MATSSHPQAPEEKREAYAAPTLEVLGTVALDTESDHYSFLGGGQSPVLSSVTYWP